MTLYRIGFGRGAIYLGDLTRRAYWRFGPRRLRLAANVVFPEFLAQYLLALGQQKAPNTSGKHKATHGRRGGP